MLEYPVMKTHPHLPQDESPRLPIPLSSLTVKSGRLFGHIVQIVPQELEMVGSTDMRHVASPAILSWTSIANGSIAKRTQQLV